jgi:sterol desaturase/sphingolipid hydroxylase (fatty acid hydroxylase superfamily)
MTEQFLSRFQFSEAAVRLTIFLCVFAAMAIGEATAPRRKLAAGRAGRWFSNLCLMITNMVLIRLIFLAAPALLAALARSKGWGLLNMFAIPSWLGVIIAVALLDLAVYLQHIMFHMLPPLWRLHLVHHADTDVDCTTGVRYHPVESIIAMSVRLAAVSVIGPAPLAVVIFEIFQSVAALFNHGNVRLPETIDRILRYAAVTPDMHRVHHSVLVAETNSNFGLGFSWWDRIFGTYRERPSAGHEGMSLGLEQYRTISGFSLPRLLILPATADPGRYDLAGRNAASEMNAAKQVNNAK